jgi:hypothetical protein
MEYALHGDPMGSRAGQAALPQASTGSTLQLTFARYLDRNDIKLTVQGADSPSGPWTDLVTSVAGQPFGVVASGATVQETGSGNSRTVIVGDVYSVSDPGHQRRFMRLQVTRP